MNGWVLGCGLMLALAAAVRAEGPEASEPIMPEETVPAESDETIVIDLDWPEEESSEVEPDSGTSAPATPPAIEPEPPATPARPEPAAATGLPPGQYLQLAFFESEDSVARFKRQIAGKSWAGDVRYWFDAAAAGHRVLLGPLSASELARQRQRLSAEGFDSFRYRAGS